ncbi:MAG: hypothetical protein U0736_25310 [Gemmataceae bacterium]
MNATWKWLSLAAAPWAAVAVSGPAEEPPAAPKKADATVEAR